MKIIQSHKTACSTRFIFIFICFWNVLNYFMVSLDALDTLWCYWTTVLPTCPALPPAGSKQRRPLCSPVHSAQWWYRWHTAQSLTLPPQGHLGGPRGHMTSPTHCTPYIAWREIHKKAVSKGTKRAKSEGKTPLQEEETNPWINRSNTPGSLHLFILSKEKCVDSEPHMVSIKYK